MGMFSFIKEAGEKLFGSKEVEDAAAKAATDEAARARSEEFNKAAGGRARRTRCAGIHRRHRRARRPGARTGLRPTWLARIDPESGRQRRQRIKNLGGGQPDRGLRHTHERRVDYCATHREAHRLSGHFRAFPGLMGLSTPLLESAQKPKQ